MATRAQKWTPRTRHTLALGLLFAPPWLVHLLMLVAYPFVASSYYSLTYYNVFRAPNFIGLEN